MYILIYLFSLWLSFLLASLTTSSIAAVYANILTSHTTYLFRSFIFLLPILSSSRLDHSDFRGSVSFFCALFSILFLSTNNSIFSNWRAFYETLVLHSINYKAAAMAARIEQHHCIIAILFTLYILMLHCIIIYNFVLILLFPLFYDQVCRLVRHSMSFHVFPQPFGSTRVLYITSVTFF